MIAAVLIFLTISLGYIALKMLFETRNGQEETRSNVGRLVVIAAEIAKYGQLTKNAKDGVEALKWDAKRDKKIKELNQLLADSEFEDLSVPNNVKNIRDFNKYKNTA